MRATNFEIIPFEDDEWEQDTSGNDSQHDFQESLSSSGYPPFTYWDVLRQESSDVPFETRPGSSVVKIPTSSVKPRIPNARSHLRLAHLASILAISHPWFGIDRVFHNAQAAGVLALKHLNERSPSVMPDLPERMDACPDLFFTMDMYDTQFSPIHAARQFANDIVGPTHSLATPHPTAIAGATLSEVSKTLAILGGVNEIPQISHISAAESLDNTETYPYFCRSSASNSGMAQGLAVFMHSLSETSRHVAILYARDELGRSHHNNFSDMARRLGISVFSAPYELHDPKSLDDAINKVINSGYKYVSLAPAQSTFNVVAQRAFELGLGGQDYVFFLSESCVDVISAGYTLNATTEYGAASILNGTGIVLLHAPGKEEYVESMQKEFLDDPATMAYYTRKHPAKDLFTAVGFDFDPALDAQVSNFAGALQNSQYDAVIAAGLAACQSETDFFTGPEVYENIKNLDFSGSSQIPTHFMNDTCSRDMQYFGYVVLNLLAKEPKDGLIRFETRGAAMVDANENVITLQNYTFRDGTSIAPPSIPDQEIDMNKIPLHFQLLAWTVAFIVMLLATALGVWTIVKRNTASVRVRQPMFLSMCCVGTCLLASSIIPMGLQEPTENLGAACMSSLWLSSVGFVVGFSALFSKTWRVNRLFNNAQRFRRHTIDVLVPFLVLSSINVIILVAMTIVAPLQWTRQFTDSLDPYGRPLESYGSCTASNDNTKWFLLPLLAINFFAVLLSNIQIFLSRNLPRNLNESKEVAFSMLMLLEACLVGIPVLIVVNESPTARFLLPTKVRQQRSVSVVVSTNSLNLRSSFNSVRRSNTLNLRFSISSLRWTSFRASRSSMGASATSNGGIDRVRKQLILEHAEDQTGGPTELHPDDDGSEFAV
ncbi:Gamma-aminobutyric acid (GABA) B receptor [Seminavis robusta]|uniref:Gamma-aminobutyric acid (GABA) B receptor n=1 Tax=Seminavis robusta TaxID=568900 RepID=A0A9N8H9R3_9STRA|nr:Gamma-aminobutyric acid (GABA) B receptor [Seminavis robusta]